MLAQLQKDDKPEEVEASAIDSLLRRLDGIDAQLAKQKGKS
jgi:hypothetical protein